MAYVCELGTGQRVYLDNQGNQTVVTTISSSLGQQQQASSSFPTGNWTAPPEVFQTPSGAVLKITTAQGGYYIQVQGGSMSAVSGMPSFGSSQQMQVQQVASPPASSMPPMQPIQPMQPMQPMEPMKPMEPLKMGDMQMNMNPMEMRMGNMEMRMGSSVSSSTSAQSTKRFCPKCGVSINLGDRFCSSCGHRLD
ncbi:MAG TPA: zinc ribbon domain-containing protein [Cyanobacteria bacterium UBA8803]|nr:zinc ribbon domain-containing protein [Cyanobacteria bacterium UBA9273]HBL60190.1 zinc ribbon domain-containing protein [Cyanobacteria bacterium UBA8803]